MKKTDNSNLEVKLYLRRFFLKKWPPHNVLDCCQGSGVIWTQLKHEFSPKTYFPVDVKPKKGRIKMNSIRLLAAGDWNFDCIDIDTYGEPWKHWQQIVLHGKKEITVFLTIGLVKVMGGRVSRELSSWCGLDPLRKIIPPSLQATCSKIAVPYALNQAVLHGFRLIEVLEAPPAKNARYIGVRMEKKV